MTRMFALLGLALFICSPVQAEKVYKYTDESGNIVFTDEPVKGAEEMDVKPVATVPAIPVPQNTAPTSTEEAPFKYTKVAVTKPNNEENFINNEGNVTVQIAIAPNLRAGDAVQLYFNGIPKGDPGSRTTFPFENLDRGEYVTQAVIFDKEGKEMAKSDPITFYVRRAALKKQPRPQPRN